MCCVPAWGACVFVFAWCDPASVAIMVVCEFVCVPVVARVVCVRVGVCARMCVYGRLVMCVVCRLLWCDERVSVCVSCML